VGFTAVRVALHRGARSRDYKLLIEEADPRSLVSGGGDVVSMGSSYCCLIARSFDLLIARSPPHMWPLLIASKGRARITFMVKG
jgi:hypothetical protein